MFISDQCVARSAQRVVIIIYCIVCSLPSGIFQRRSSLSQRHNNRSNRCRSVLAKRDKACLSAVLAVCNWFDSQTWTDTWICAWSNDIAMRAKILVHHSRAHLHAANAYFLLSPSRLPLRGVKVNTSSRSIFSNELPQRDDLSHLSHLRQ